jgi:long-chain acyl-CoA synthetase
MNTAVAQLLESSACRSAAKPALITQERTLTFAELNNLSTCFSAGLLAMGVQAGDRVALWLGNGWRWVVAYYGILRLGAIVTPANVLLAPSEVWHMMGDCKSHTLIARSKDISREDTAIASKVITVGESNALTDQSFDEVLKIGAGAVHKWTQPQIDGGSVCSIFYTSGTTGYPKGAMLTHESVLFNAKMTSRMQGLNSSDTIVSPLPCAHVYGNVVLNSSIARGATLVLLPRVDDAGILEAIRCFNATILEGVPAMYLALLGGKDVDRVPFGTLRFCAVGGQGMAVEKMREVEMQFGCRLIELWGMTEIAGLGATHPVDAPPHLGSIGIPFSRTQTRIADPDDPSRDVALGQVGELLIRGPHVMKGYLNKPIETAQVLDSDGWLKSGDLVRQGDDGYLYLVDRIKDVILSGGYTVYPAEIERVVAQLPTVSAAVALPVQDELRGQVARLLVVLRPGATCGAEDILSHCRRMLASYKVPRIVEFVPNLPTSCTGKVVRNKEFRADLRPH